MLDADRNIKIVDFGLSNTYKAGERLKTACGSPCYAAPEMIAGKKYIGIQVDIWSAGVVLYAIVCGFLPFEDPNTANLYKKILGGEYTLPKFLSSDAKDLIKGILNTDPTKRFTVEQIRNHPWFNKIPRGKQQGIIVGVHQMPVEAIIIKKLEDFGFNAEYAEKCVEANKHNSATTAYYLLLKKFLKEGGKSKADLASTEYEPVSIGRKIIKTLKEEEEKRQIIGDSSVGMAPHPPSEEKEGNSSAFSVKNRRLFIAFAPPKEPK